MNPTSTYQCKRLSMRRRIYVGIGYRDYWLFDSSGNKLQPRIVRKGVWYYKVWDIDTCGSYYLLVVCPVSPHSASGALFTSQPPTPRAFALTFGGVTAQCPRGWVSDPSLHSLPLRQGVSIETGLGFKNLLGKVILNSPKRL